MNIPSGVWERDCPAGQTSFSAAALDPVPFLILPLFEKLGPAQRFFAFVAAVIGMAAGIMLEITFVSVVAAQAADGFPKSFQMLEHR
jgi:hypothetical protein